MSWTRTGKSDDGRWIFWRHASGRMAATPPGALPAEVQPEGPTKLCPHGLVDLQLHDDLYLGIVRAAVHAMNWRVMEVLQKHHAEKMLRPDCYVVSSTEKPANCVPIPAFFG